MASQHKYKIMPVVGKGLGMIATTNIERGTRVLAEKAMISWVQSLESDDQKAESFGTALAGRVSSLNQEQRKQFFALANVHVKLTGEETNEERCAGIARTNAAFMSLRDGGVAKRGIFPVAARINHSCNPNCHATWNDNIGKLTVHAMSDICEGQEITVSYISTPEERDRRQGILGRVYGFTCTCDFCTLPKDKGADRDYILREWRKLHDKLKEKEANMTETDPEEYLALVYKIIDMFAQTGITDDNLAKAFGAAYMVASYHGDEARASVFAERTRENLFYIAGPDHLDTIKYKKLAKDPAKDPGFGVTTTWATTAAAPNPMAGDHETWLWRGANLALNGPQAPPAAPTNYNQSAVADFRDPVHFPAFDALPDKHCVDPAGFYFNHQSSDGLPMHKVSAHWCLLAEVMEVNLTAGADLIVMDKDGLLVRVLFTTDDGGLGFGPQLVPGNTIAILYPIKADDPGNRPLIVQSTLRTVRVCQHTQKVKPWDVQ